MDDFLRHSDDGLINSVMLLSDRNTLNVIVEDTGKEFIYEKIFFRLLKDTGININKVFPMGGKTGVIKAFETYGKTYDNKSVLYLVDGDFDLFLDKPIINDDNFLYLPNYNIEDYYLDETAITNFVSCKIKKINEETKLLMEYDTWLETSLNNLLDLFLCFVIIQKYLPTEPNVEERSPLSFCNQITGQFDISIISNYINIKKQKISEYETKYLEAKEIFSTLLDQQPLRIICGKYLLIGLARYLSVKLNKKISFEELENNLILNFDVNSLNFIKNKIIELCSLQTNFI